MFLKRLVPLLFILFGCALLAGGVSILGAAILYHPADVPGAFDWTPPLQQVDDKALAPATIVLPLTGAQASAALSAAFDNANIENAYALVAYDPTLTDPARIGALLQLGSQYKTARLTRKAANCYQEAALLATLSPAVSDPAREDTYLQAGSALHDLGAADAARMVADQAYLVAQNSPAIQPQPRARLLGQIAEAYAALGATSLASQARSKADDALTTTTPAQDTDARVPFTPKVGALPASPAVDGVKAARVAAAQQLADDLTNAPPKTAADWPQDSVAQLRSALEDEDAARQTYYDQEIAQATDPAVQLALWQDRVAWLAVKYRVARGAFGIDLVPDWSKDAATIATDWGDALTSMYSLEATQAAALSNPQDAQKADEEVIRRQLIAVRWGWLSGTSEQDVRSALADATQKLRDDQYPDLFLDSITRSGKTVYLLLPDELYGTNEQALPR
ncbi:MAG: hypothetical protein M1482_10465 [Chloroflexi bacterium]|nr:hypothetical protein [Chloroflexota bacterium]